MYNDAMYHYLLLYEEGGHYGMGTKDKMHELIEALYEQNYKKMMSMVAKDPLCNPMAEDIVQDTFYEAVRKWDTLEHHENPGGWLMDTAKYKMMAYRKRMNLKSLKEVGDVEQELECFKNEYGMIELSMIMDEALSVHEKTLFHMFYMEGYSVKEMAGFEKISEGNFRVKMLRIREKVKKALGRGNTGNKF